MKPVDLAFASKNEEKRWIKEEAVDPSGKIVPQKFLAGFWIKSKTASRPSMSSKTRRQPEVVLYLVGGGYITGHPLEASRVFDIARMTGIPVLGVYYRKSVTSLCAFPAPLQDTISAYAYLLRRGYTRIALAGDSAGAGLGMALLQYLSRMVIAEAKIESSPDEMKLVLPVAACFYSPWVDLTFSHDYKETVHFDISQSAGPARYN
jgi:acetyl esterase/lipase